MTTHACLLTNDDNEYANLHTEDIKFLIYKILLFYYVFSFFKFLSSIVGSIFYVYTVRCLKSESYILKRYG